MQQKCFECSCWLTLCLQFCCREMHGACLALSFCTATHCHYIVSQQSSESAFKSVFTRSILYIASQEMPNAHACAAESPYLSPTWNYNMPEVHPFTTFMEHINVNLETLYSDGTRRRAGSHALHALAVLLETRGLFESSDGSCYHACCVPSRRGVGLPSTLSRYACAEWPCCSSQVMQEAYVCVAACNNCFLQVLLGPPCKS